MRIRQRAMTDFEVRSVALFALLALGGALHARAQTAPAPMTTATPAPIQRTAAAMPASQVTLDQIAEAFQRTDANRDGQISRDEARIWNGLTRQFDKVDADRNGAISNAEFLDALK